MPLRHSWDLSPKEAIELQKKLLGKVRTDLKLGPVRRIAAVDAAYLPKQQSTVAACVLLEWPGMRLLEERWHVEVTRFPYVPGLLSFREIPAVLEAFGQLSEQPDLVFVDGHGQAHPRRMGIATHLGMWLGLPTIGIAKSKLCGEYTQPALEKGATAPLKDRDEVIGLVLRSRRGVKPIFVSVGYGLPLRECLQWAMATTSGYKLPEPIRLADRLSKRAKLDWLRQVSG